MNKSLKVNFFDNVDEIIRQAKRKFGKDKKFAFARWPDGSLRLIWENARRGRNDQKTTI